MFSIIDRFRSIFLKLMCVVLVVGCVPVPMKHLSQEDRLTDIMWVFSIFKENYAPLDYKSKRLGLNIEELKKKYITAAFQEQSNDSFYMLIHRLVAEFQDAHTSASLSNGNLPGLAQIAYVGISGKRKGKVFVVTELFPGFDSEKSNFPIKVGDEISHVDGKPLYEVIQEQFIPFQNLGYEEANFTYHMNRIFTRVSLHDPFPSSEDLEVTIVGREYSAQERTALEKRGVRKLDAEEKKLVKIKETIPWIVTDLAVFKSEQESASAKPSESEKGSVFSPLLGLLNPNKPKGADLISGLGLKNFDGSVSSPATLFGKLMPSIEGFSFLNTFYLPNQVESWTVKAPQSPKNQVSTKDLLQTVRAVPEDADFFTDEKATFPAYVTSEIVYDRKGKPTAKKRLVATLYVNTFSPDTPEEEVLEEFNKTIDRLQKYGIQHLIIDLLNNGGGSLSLGLRMAQALSPVRIAMPEVQFKISETWLREFRKASLPGAFGSGSSAEREVASRVFERLATEYAAGKSISDPMPVHVLMPFDLKPNLNLKKKFKVVLLVNEMCASMCDIFSGIMQDNNLAEVMGSRTMGAGGNVVAHFYAPNSGLVLRQTESLMLRNDPSQASDPSYATELEQRYIENKGVEPDFAPMSVSEYSVLKYRPVWQEAVRYLTHASPLQANHRVSTRAHKGPHRAEIPTSDTMHDE